MNLLQGIVIACLALAALPFPNRAADGETALRYEQPTRLSGTIYEVGSDQKRVLFKFRRAATRSGATLNILREFTYPDGKVAARERAVYAGDNLVSFELEDLQSNARGTATVLREPGSDSKGAITFTYSDNSDAPGKATSNTESLRPDTLVNDMVGPFLAAHWDELMKGAAVKCRYIVPARAETVGFKFVKQSESVLQGKPVVVIKMSPSSFIVAALVDPLLFTVEKTGEHRILEYEGRTTPKTRDGDKWKDLDAVSVFDWE